MTYDRTLLGKLRSSKSRGKVRLVFGARQTGKSTLFQLLMDKTTILIDLQKRSERIRLGQDPEILSRRLLPAGNKHRHVFIDEIQRVPELLDEIQLIVDRNPGKFTFTLTGSSARRIRRGAANLLPGRAHTFHLSGISLWEQETGQKGIILASPTKLKNHFPRKSLRELLIRGCLPAGWVEGESFIPTLESYAELYLEEEIQREALVRGIGRFGNFLQLAALESGKTINLTKLSGESGIPISTLQGFYPILEDTLTGFRIFPFSRSSRVRTLKTPKFYFFDVGVRNAVARVPLDEKLLASEGGYLFEHWLACEIATRINYLGRRYRLSYWRTAGGAEVDLVLETPSEVIPIEAKYTKNPRPADASGIERFITKYPNVKRGFVVCRVEQVEQLSKHVTAIPWNRI